MSKYECSKDLVFEKASIKPLKLDLCFKVKPLNKISYPGMKISTMTILDPLYARNVVKKKIERKLDIYLSFLASSAEDDDGDSSYILDNLLIYRETILLKYSKYLSKKELSKILREISFIEKKLRMKIINNKFANNQEKFL